MAPVLVNLNLLLVGGLYSRSMTLCVGFNRTPPAFDQRHLHYSMKEDPEALRVILGSPWLVRVCAVGCFAKLQRSIDRCPAITQPESSMRVLSLLVLFFGHFANISVVHAGPTMVFPEVSGGGNPYRNFSGYLSTGESVELLTVPDDQDFIITLVATEQAGNRRGAGGESLNDGFELLSDGEVVLSAEAIGRYSSASIAKGNAHLRIEAGARLVIQYLRSGDPSSYYIQGYLGKSGSPYRSFNGPTPTATFTNHSVFTADLDRDFLVRTVVLKAKEQDWSACQLTVDGALKVEGPSAALYDGEQFAPPAPAGAFVIGKGTLVVPAGSTLGIDVKGVLCEYYIDGEYIRL